MTSFFKGNLRLVKAVSQHYSRSLNREIDPLTEILITVGAYGSLHNAFTALVEKDDQVIFGMARILLN
jgi:aspartate/methionine/tyrosine aminotransferase